MNTPKAVVDAVFPNAQRIESLALTSSPLTLKPLTVGRHLLLEKLDSPFTRSAEEKTEKPESPTPLDWVRAILVLTIPSEKLQSYYEGFDRAEFEREMWAFNETLLARELAALIPKVLEIFKVSTSTMIGGGEEDQSVDEEDEEAKKKQPASKASTAKANRVASAGH